MNDNELKNILKNSKTIAMIGISSEKKGEDRKNLKRKPANVVMKYMQDFGYKVYPINPFAEGEIINGEKVIGSLDKIYDEIDIVDVFRPSNEAAGIANETVKKKAKFSGFNMEFITMRQKKSQMKKIYHLFQTNVLNKNIKDYFLNLILSSRF